MAPLSSFVGAADRRAGVPNIERANAVLCANMSRGPAGPWQRWLRGSAGPDFGGAGGRIAVGALRGRGLVTRREGSEQGSVCWWGGCGGRVVLGQPVQAAPVDQNINAACMPHRYPLQWDLSIRWHGHLAELCSMRTGTLPGLP